MSVAWIAAGLDSAAVGALAMPIDDHLASAGVGITHHFVGGLYAKETHIPAGTILTQHVHAFDHLSALMRGSVLVTVDGISTAHQAPMMLTIKAGSAHAVSALTDALWVCLHATDQTDPAKVDSELVA